MNPSHARTDPPQAAHTFLSVSWMGAENIILAGVLHMRRSASMTAARTSAAMVIKPFGYEDNYTITSYDPITLDVIANDYDCNNDPLNVELRDTVSYLGATISLSVGTGPGGRDEILYTPSPNQASGEDFFHYTVVDPGRFHSSTR